MIYLMMFALAVGAFLLVGYGLYLIVQYRTNSEIRASKEKDVRIKELRHAIAGYKMRQAIATDSLNKIRSNYSHNPALEANECLDTITAHEIKELETND